jgi:hypothetical protein
MIKSKDYSHSSFALTVLFRQEVKKEEEEKKESNNNNNSNNEDKEENYSWSLKNLKLKKVERVKWAPNRPFAKEVRCYHLDACVF